MKRKRILIAFTLTLIAVVALAFNGCAPKYERRNPLGERFPSVTGNSLEGEAVRLPEAFAGRPVLLLVGYQQNSQFDLDRWLLGLSMANVDVAVREVPTIPGLIPGMFAGAIDDGMRQGIPDEDWGSVVTVYGDGEVIAKFTGNVPALPGRILLLDADGVVGFFHDEGYSVGALSQLVEVVRSLGDRDPG